jgi:hypothetical protein
MKLGQLGRPLTDTERGHLTSLMQHPGFGVLTHIFEEEVEEMNVELLNVASSDDKAIIAKHHMAKAAAMFYARIVKRITNEQSIFGSGPDNNPQPDVTETLFQ